MHTTASLDELARTLHWLNPSLTPEEIDTAAAVIGDIPATSPDGSKVRVHGQWLRWLPDYSEIEFAPDHVALRIDGHPATLVFNGEKSIITLLDGTPAPSLSDDSLDELAARWLRWKSQLLPESVADNPQILDGDGAILALSNHLEALGLDN